MRVFLFAATMFVLARFAALAQPAATTPGVRRGFGQSEQRLTERAWASEGVPAESRVSFTRLDKLKKLILQAPKIASCFLCNPFNCRRY